MYPGQKPALVTAELPAKRKYYVAQVLPALLPRLTQSLKYSLTIKQMFLLVMILRPK